MGTWIDASSSSLPSLIDITNEVGAEEKTAVKHFEVTRPSLHDIFVRIARPRGENNELA